MELTTQSALETLRAQAPGLKILCDEASRLRASVDNARVSFLPDAQLTVSKPQEVGILLRLANEHKIPVTPRGAGSGTTGAASPLRGGWALDLTALNKLHIDAVRGLATVGPGVTVEAMDRAAAAEGWFFPPDPSSKKHATAGGIVSTNAGGMRGAKYGVTRDYVLALQGFLPNGEPVSWGAPLRKYVSGYNLRDLWVGAEGTLGVITEITFRLIPRPQSTHTFLAAYPDEASALDVVAAVAEARLIPSVLEFLDSQTVACVETRHGPLFDRPAETPTPTVLLLEVDGTHESVAQDRQRLLPLLEPNAAHLADTADAAHADKLWEVRRRCSQAMFALGDTKLNEDIVVPPEAYQLLLHYTRTLQAETGLATPTFGHAADGNFHVHIMFNRHDAGQRQRAEIAVRELMKHVVELDGCITGEHGIGLAKSPFLHLQHSPAEIAAMKAIKQALDPNDILNPGKIFEPFNVWEVDPIEIRLPWDH
ncbi:MAG: FAD-binding oxidoreductase [Opitutales bacterium]